MKKIFFTLLTLGLLYNTSSAQYCGNSGPDICDTIALSAPGFSPTTDSLAPMINGQISNTVIYFQNYDSVQPIGRINSLKIDSITNLPAGLCWAMGAANNTFGNKQNGCIKIAGTPCAATGVYKLNVYAKINGVIPVSLESRGLKYFIRVNNSGDATTPLDTSQSTPFVSYNAAPTGCVPASVKEIDGASISSLNVYPNPMNNRAEVKFISSKTGEMTERITNIIGREVVNSVRDVRSGNNTFTIERGVLPAGVYFYSLSDGRTLVTKRLIISE